MGRRLQEMTLEELWELFPIELKPHDPRWIKWARVEKGRLSHILDAFRPVINHIGSTAIPDIQAKPIVDILVEVRQEAEFSEIRRILESKGYICMSDSGTRISFNKGYTPEGYAERVFHIHVHRTGDNDELLFRDYLLAHPETGKDYERLKQSLLPRFRNDRDGYTAAKSEFVCRTVLLARLSRK